jgi:hypothetical protein
VRLAHHGLVLTGAYDAESPAERGGDFGRRFGGLFGEGQMCGAARDRRAEQFEKPGAWLPLGLFSRLGAFYLDQGDPSQLTIISYVDIGYRAGVEGESEKCVDADK